jgi:predicted DNA-binding transcriptional regulator AlpA
MSDVSEMPDVQGGAMRPEKAAEYIGVAISTLWKIAKEDPSFPRPFKLSSRCTLIYRAQLDAWLASKATQSQRAA